MNKNLKLIIAVSIIGVIILAGCCMRILNNFHKSESAPSKEPESDLIIVGFSQLGSESDWRTANTKSIQNSLVKENGFSLIFANGRQSQENQIKDVRSFIFQEVDYIVLAPVTETGWDTVLEEAKEAGIPVIVVDRMIDTQDDSLFVASVGTDKYEEGRKAGLWLEQYLKEQESDTDSMEIEEKEKDSSDEVDELTQVDKEKEEDKRDDNEDEEDEEDKGTVHIVVLEGTKNSTSQIGRSKGFEDIASSHDNWKILAHEDGDFTKAKGKEVMKKYLKKYDDIDVLVSQNDDMTFGAIEAIGEAGLTCGVDGQIKIISFDAVSEAFEMMEQGLINVDIECNPLQGELIADIIRSIERGEKVDKMSYVDEKVFDAKNASTDRVGRSY